MKEEDIKIIARSEAQRIYSQNQSTGQFGVNQTSFHTHNGTDSPRINQNNITTGTTAFLDFGVSGSGTGTINTLQNITFITGHGIAYDTSANPIVKKALITSEARLGKCYLYNWQGNTDNIPVSGGFTEPYLQKCNAAYFDTSNLAHTKVMASGDSLLGGYSKGYFINVFDETHTTGDTGIVARVQITGWTGTKITLTYTVAPNWIIETYLSMS